MGPPKIKLFLTYLALHRKVGPSTRNQALGALLFLYRRVLGRDPPAPRRPRVPGGLRLRVQDLDFEGGAIVVRQGKGQKDRRTLLAKELVPTLRRLIEDTQCAADFVGGTRGATAATLVKGLRSVATR